MKLTNELCTELFNALSLDTKRNLIAFAQELQAAKEKHPKWPKDFIHAAAIVAEESGELIRASIQQKYEKGRYYEMHKEAIQTGAMCLRFLENAPDLPIKYT